MFTATLSAKCQSAEKWMNKEYTQEDMLCKEIGTDLEDIYDI